jgi:digeranylgeranylglycerophospholipid reductase
MRKLDVLIIGAGPAGSTVAKEIAKKGFNTLLIEKDTFPGENKICAGCTGYAKSSILKVPERIVEKNIHGSITYFSWGESVRAINVVPCINVYRRIFDNYLANEAVMNGARLLTSTYVYDVLREKKLIKVYLKNLKTLEKSQVFARCVVFSDGPNSLAAKKFGIGFKGRPDNTGLGAIYEMRWDNNPLEYNEFYFDRKVSPWGYGWIFPKRNTVNVGVFCLLSKLKRNIRDLLDYLVKKHPIASKKLSDRKVVRFGVKLIPLEHAKKISSEQILVIGDAAGMVDPVWGGGIPSAIYAAKIAGKVLIKALENDDLSKTSLSRYDEMWIKSKQYKALPKPFWPKIIYNPISGPVHNLYRYVRFLHNRQVIHEIQKAANS